MLSQRKKKIKEAEKKKISLENVSRKDTHVQPTQSGKEMKPPGAGEAVASHVCGNSAQVLSLNKLAFPVSYGVTESHLYTSLKSRSGVLRWQSW